MTDALKPSLALLAKIGSIIVHVDEGLSDGGHVFDWDAARALMRDPEVIRWMRGMQRQNLLPVRRKKL